MKTAKRLMTKACEAGTDPFLALLEWRNCPSEQLSQAPVELLMGRKTRTTLPIAAPLLHTHTVQAAPALLCSRRRTHKRIIIIAQPDSDRLCNAARRCDSDMMINSGGRVRSVPPYHTARTKFSSRMVRLGDVRASTSGSPTNRH